MVDIAASSLGIGVAAVRVSLSSETFFWEVEKEGARLRDQDSSTIVALERIVSDYLWQQLDATKARVEGELRHQETRTGAEK